MGYEVVSKVDLLQCLVVFKEVIEYLRAAVETFDESKRVLHGRPVPSWLTWGELRLTKPGNPSSRWRYVATPKSAF
jgi:hypothetical protein